MANSDKFIPYTNSIFQQPFWLDAVAPDQWDAVEVRVGDEVRARMPYVMTRNRAGMNILSMPPLTQTLGPWLAAHEAKYTAQLSRQKDLMNALIAQLPPHHYFYQRFHYSINNWLPFHWNGFDETTRYTYVIEDLTDLERVWAELQVNIRGEVRKASRQVEVRTDLDIERFIDINNQTFQRQGKSLPYSRDLVCRLDEACSRHDARRSFFAEDAQGRIHAAIYVVWDKNSAYYLMGASDPEFRNSGATSLLIWEAIQFAATVTQKFDFEGSMIEPIERFFRAFGARQKPFFAISKMSRRMRIVHSLAGGMGQARAAFTR